MIQFIMNYDIKLGGDGKKKSDLHFEYIVVPNRTGRFVEASPDESRLNKY